MSTSTDELARLHRELDETLQTLKKANDHQGRQALLRKMRQLIDQADRMARAD